MLWENNEVICRMNIALILSGGIGNRMKMGNIPKQYLLFRGRPIFDYSVSTFQSHPMIDGILIVADPNWRNFINEWLGVSSISKFLGYAIPGDTRQLSIKNGLFEINQLNAKEINVIIHDAARPLVSSRVITECLNGLEDYDGVMPVIPVKDTCYYSENGHIVSGTIPREHLYAGQSPEAFKFEKYFKLHCTSDDDYLKTINGSSELAYQNGLSIKMISGEEMNLKITTKSDLDLFEKFLNCEALK